MVVCWRVARTHIMNAGVTLLVAWAWAWVVLVVCGLVATWVIPLVHLVVLLLLLALVQVLLLLMVPPQPYTQIILEA